MLTISVRQHLSNKLKPIFALLNQLQGVLGSDTILKQRGEEGKDQEKSKPQVKKLTDEQHEEKPKIDQKVNEASRSGKEKEKFINDKEEEEMLSEGEKLIRKKRDNELNEIERVRKQLKAKERGEMAAKVTLQTQEYFFSPWTMERILNEAVDNPRMH